MWLWCNNYRGQWINERIIRSGNTESRTLRKELNVRKAEKTNELKSNKIKETCSECGEKFSLRTQFVSHCKSVHGIEKAFKCQLCSVRVRRRSHLKRHLTTHEDIPRFRCEHCDSGFYQKSNLEVHVRRRHSKEIVARCEECNKGFFCKAALDNHKITHTGLRPFGCELCDKNYMNKAHLSAHKRWSHPELYDTDRYHRCKICSKTFPYEKKLVRHLESHEGVRNYLCDYCGKKVSTLNSLTHHRRTHTGEKPEVCNVCGRAFTSPKYLKEHFRTHTGEKPFTCSFCGRGFAQRGSLSLHEKSHRQTKSLVG